MKGIVSFYEKPGCRGNAKQKAILTEAGYKLQVINLLEKEWEADALLQFFGSLPAHECVNLSAPRIKKGDLNISELDADELLQEMIADPILIKRPLLFFRGQFGCGFQCDLIEELLGEEPEDIRCQKSSLQESCN